MTREWRHLVVLAAALSCRPAGPVRALAAEETPVKSPAPATKNETDPAGEIPAREKYTLAYKFRLNQVMNFEVSQETEIRTTVKEETETVRNSSKARRHLTVKAVDEKAGTADLELFIDWVHMLASFENPSRAKTEPIEFQSDDPEKHPKQFEDVLATVGKPRATIRFSTSGKPVKVLEGALPPPPAAANPLAKGPAARPVADTTPETYFIPLPEGPVAVGESWKELFDLLLYDNLKNPVKVTIQRNYRLAEVTAGRATIELRTTVLTPVKNPAIAGQLIQREISGKVVFDLEHGAVVTRESGVDNSVIGPFGDKSSMQARSKYREKLLDDEATAERKPAAGTATK